jgi:hypothetical protein
MIFRFHRPPDPGRDRQGGPVFKKFSKLNYTKKPRLVEAYFGRASVRSRTGKAGFSVFSYGTRPAKNEA